jgi:hypothetical protein
MAVDCKHFFRLTAANQLKYLEEGEFVGCSRAKKIEFLKIILNMDLPPATAVCALGLLKELNYPDRYYFKKFLYHPDNSVANTAKKAIDEWCKRGPGPANDITLVEVLREGKSDDLILLANFFLDEDRQVNEQTLISFLRTGDAKVRETIVNKVTPDHQLDDAKLSEAINKGNTWYVRAALVEILGNRRSEHLFDCIDFLMSDRNVVVKLKLFDALSKLEMAKGKTYLEKLTGDPTVWVRKEAKRALQTM